MAVAPGKIERLSDEELMRLVVARDAVAFEALYERYGRRAFSLSYRILGDRVAAEDSTQEAFLAVWRGSSGYDRGRGGAGAWIMGVVRNRAIDVLRSRSSPVPALDHDDQAALEARPSVESTDGQAIRHETERELHTVLGDLPDEQSRVIELAYFGGFSQSEIAEMLRLPLGTVKGRMRLGLEKMRGTLSGGMA